MKPSGIYDVAELVRSCVCDQMDALAETEEGYTSACCISYVSAGEPQVECCNTGCGDGGMLTVHVESVFPSDNFPQPFAAFDPCKAGTWVAVVVVTAARCTPVAAEGTLPPMAELEAVAALLAIDQYAILSALSCCVPSDPVAGKRKRRVFIDSDTPQTSEGGCATVQVRAFVEVGRVCNCTSES